MEVIINPMLLIGLRKLQSNREEVRKNITSNLNTSREITEENGRGC